MQIPAPVKVNYSFSDLPVRPDWLERLMGYPEGQTPPEIREIIEAILEKAPAHCKIEGGYVMTGSFEIPDRDRFNVGELEFKAGRIITRCLRDSHELIFYLMTAGPGIEAWSRQMMEEGDPLSAYIIDMLGSEIVETATDLMQDRLEKEMKLSGFSISNRYGPGYCGWHVSEQQKLFSLFPENFCGISLTESSLMVPIKSTSGIIGAGKQLEKLDYSCNVCEMQDCIYRDRKEFTEYP